MVIRQYVHSVIFVFLLLGAFGCRQSEVESEEPKGFIILDWSFRAQSTYYAVQGFFGLENWPNAMSTGDTVVCNGIPYMRSRYFRIDETPESQIVEIMVGKIERPDPDFEFDVRVSSKVLFGIKIENGPNCVLLNAEKSQIIEEPYIFSPGDYHFRLVEREDL
jgi:hypothetical protein